VAVVAAAGTYEEAWTLAELSQAGWLGGGERQAHSLRSFDRSRDGTVPAEGAVALVLETPAHARHRGARVLACIQGAAGRACALGQALPDSAYSQAARQALGWDRVHAHDAHPDSGGVDALLADGKGTRDHDSGEMRLLRHLCADLARRVGPAALAVPVTTVRPIAGAIPAAGGLMDVALAAQMLHTGCIPPVPGLEDPEDTALDWVRGGARQRPLRRVLTLQHGFGGFCSAFAVEHPALHG
jgi:3-oxoacyl-(acyl-carrier-protein) synthase